MAKHKVSELEGALLDAAVAKAEGFDYFRPPPDREGFAPHRSWTVSGPIIERERINVGFDDQGGTVRGEWAAYMHDGDGSMWFAGTPLIAAMRAYVASKFGDDVELP